MGSLWKVMGIVAFNGLPNLICCAEFWLKVVGSLEDANLGIVPSDAERT